MERIRAAAVLALDLLLTAAYIFLCRINGRSFGDQLTFYSFALFPLVGAVLMARHPRSEIAHITSFLGLSVLGASTLFEYASLALNQQIVPPPFTGAAAVISLSMWTVTLPSLTQILLRFPNGMMPGWVWKAVSAASLAVTAPLILATLVVGWRNRDSVLLMDAGLIEGSPELRLLFRAYDIWNLVMIAIVMLALVSFFLRLARSRGIERQQLKWISFGLSIIPVSLIFTQLAELFNSPVVNLVDSVLNNLSIAAFPIVMLIAITRYRLYDIDLIIRRTLLYTAITITLALVYFSLVLLMQTFFTWRFGEQPGFVIVLSTLLIAMLFQPLRRRFQAAIDRRFYRSKYDAEQTVERFAAYLQSEVDMDEISRSLMAVVEENMQPEHVSLVTVRKNAEPGE